MLYKGKGALVSGPKYYIMKVIISNEMKFPAPISANIVKEVVSYQLYVSCSGCSTSRGTTGQKTVGTQSWPAP
jgi:hypothetical protein